MDADGGVELGAARRPGLMPGNGCMVIDSMSCLWGRSGMTSGSGPWGRPYNRTTFNNGNTRRHGGGNSWSCGDVRSSWR